MEAIAFIALIPVLAVFGLIGWVLWKVLLGVVWAVSGILRTVGRLLLRVLRFGRGTLVQGLHTVGALATAAAMVPLALANLLIGRGPAARHYGRAVRDEFANVLSGLYRVAIAGPLRFVGLGGVLGGVERRLADVVDHAPRSAADAWRAAPPDGFPGYEVLGTLPSGGSGARLFLARPLAATVERLRAAGRAVGDRVVIKSFALSQGSTLPQIVRESRALEAASRLGLVLEHDLRPERFHYVTRYVEGERLDVVAGKLHARSGPEGLDRRALSLVLGYAEDLLRTLHGFHSGGLWHKDVKPANVIVADRRAHLVDFGLVTPLASALTLTTHGTEYYRDPEMVRLALQGVKVHEVDGVKFDLYSTGAVLYSLLEDSFPAQGSLSRISKRAPEALKWIVRRAMADIGARYASAAAMLADLRVVAEAADPFAVRPAELPSYRGQEPAEPAPFVLEGMAESRAAHAPLRLARDGGLPPHEWLADERSRRERRSRCSRRRFAAVAAAGVGMLVVMSVAEERRNRHASVTFHQPQLFAHEVPAYRQAQAIFESVQDVREGLARAGRSLGARASVPSSPAPPAALVAPGGAAEAERFPLATFADGERVLLLADGQADELLAELEQGLVAAGVEVLCLARDGEPRSDEPQVIQLVALARHAAGLGGLRDADARADLARWLEDERALDGLVWIGPDEDGSRWVLVLGAEGPGPELARLDAERGVLASR